MNFRSSSVARRLLAASALAAAAFASPSAMATPVNGAGFSSVNENIDGTGHCKNGNPDVNCNIYDGKEFVWMNGGPLAAQLGDGTYFFAVLVPSGQGGNDDPNDGTPNDLSDISPTSGTGAGDSYTNRTFTISGGILSYSGTHTFDGNRIRLMPYDDTTNPGGVYILAICSLADGYPVAPRNCKYDAFKVQQGDVEPPPCDTCQPPPPCDPATQVCEELPTVTLSKTASGRFDQTFAWTIGKSVDRTYVRQVGGTASFNYTVTASVDDGTVSNVQVSGDITATLNNATSATGTISDGLLDPGATCTITGGASVSLAFGANTFPYTCTFNDEPLSINETNTAVLDWMSGVTEGTVDASANFSFAVTDIDDCIAVSDTYGGTLGNVCLGDANPKTFTYSRAISIPEHGCLSFPNTASFVTNDTGGTGSASQSVTVCGPPLTGARTIGFWQNKNGQGIILGGASTAGVCNSGTWLRQYAPFQDLGATANCTAVNAYVTKVIKAASAGGATMNAMLKAQMLATALDVYFSTPSLGGNPLGAASPLGSFVVDLTFVKGGNVSAAFGGATSLTVSQCLSYAASQSNVGGSAWYGQVKSMQEMAKDTFDAINNEQVFSP
jgi:hypothetical protein